MASYTAWNVIDYSLVNKQSTSVLLVSLLLVLSMSTNMESNSNLSNGNIAFADSLLIIRVHHQ